MGRIFIFLYLPLMAACGQSKNEQQLHEADTLRFFALGDWGRDGTNHQQDLADAMATLAARRRVDFVLSLGDNFYPDGVDSLADPQWNSSFEAVYQGALIKTPWYVALGNHDYLGIPRAQISYSKRSSRWQMPYFYYTKLIKMKHGENVRMVILDTSPFEKSYYASDSFRSKLETDTIRQKAWMDSVFSLRDADWTIVSGHHPLYTGGLRVNDYNSVRSSLLPIFTRFNLPVYFAGHEHDLQHLKSPSSPTHQFVSGAGSELRPTGSMPFTEFSASIQGFMSAEVTKNALDVYIISYELDTLYKTRLVR